MLTYMVYSPRAATRLKLTELTGFARRKLDQSHALDSKIDQVAATVAVELSR